jgi:hypothetical protein
VTLSSMTLDAQRALSHPCDIAETTGGCHSITTTPR